MNKFKGATMCIIGLQKLIANSVFGQQIVCSDAGWILLYAVTSRGSWCNGGKFKKYYLPNVPCHRPQWVYSDLCQFFDLVEDWVGSKGWVENWRGIFLSKRLFNLFNLFQDPTWICESVDMKIPRYANPWPHLFF